MRPPRAGGTAEGPERIPRRAAAPRRGGAYLAPVRSMRTIEGLDDPSVEPRLRALVDDPKPIAPHAARQGPLNSDVIARIWAGLVPAFPSASSANLGAITRRGILPR